MHKKNKILTLTQIMENKFDKLSYKKKVDVLFSAIDYMQQYNARSVPQCIALAMGYNVFTNDMP